MPYAPRTAFSTWRWKPSNEAQLDKAGYQGAYHTLDVGGEYDYTHKSLDQIPSSNRVEYPRPGGEKGERSRA